MANGERTSFDSLAAIFQVRDLPEALAFYVDVLGFEIAWTHGEPPSYASVRRDRVEINFGAPSEGQAVSPSSVYISLTHIDAFYERIRAAGASVTLPIGDRPYGMRDFNIVDPSGNALTFGQPTAG
jgi:predicted enzyme related to lactoylglutathione lyase